MSVVQQPVLWMRSIGKSFPGVRALDGVTLDLRAGEIHALVGENGAGKSTLMKILSGVYAEHEGDIELDGRRLRFRNVREAERAGVRIVHQELSLVREMTVGENIFLGREPRRMGVIAWDELYSRAGRLLAELGLDADPRAAVAELGVGRQQLVEIAKALSQEARVLVLDEPTAALTEAEAEKLFKILEGLKTRGIGIFYISHRLEEVFAHSDRITVLRDGRTVETTATSETDPARVIAAMVGREVSDMYPAAGRVPGEVVLEARHVVAEDPDVAGRQVVRDVSLSLRRGEVVGVAGLMGAGRTELLQALFGCHPGRVSKEVVVGGRPVPITCPRDAIALGIGFVTEDRKASGLVLEESILTNLTLAALKRISGGVVTREEREVEAAGEVAGNLRVKAASLFTPVGTLSGGNQQKVVLGKWLLTEPRVLLLDEPTRGIDVGARQEIYAEIDRLARSGLAVLMVSSELEEVLNLSDRVLVLHEGRLTGELDRVEATPEAVMACATGQEERLRLSGGGAAVGSTGVPTAGSTGQTGEGSLV